MSQVTENSGLPTLTAGNTVSTLQGTDVLDASISPIGNPFAGAGLPSAADLDATVEKQTEEQAAKDATTLVEDDPENTFDVSRAEFEELRDAFLRQGEAIKRFNAGSPHKIQ